MSFGRDYPEDYTSVTIVFTTHDGNGAPVAPLSAFEAADVTIYKNGATAKSTTNGVTMTSPLNSKTGLHAVIIDTSNDTGDSGFWTTGGGSVYSVVLDPDTETVNSQTVRKVIGEFSIAVSPVNWGRVSAPTTSVALSGTTVGTVTAVTGLTASNLDTTVSSRLASGSYTAPSNLTAAQIATGVWQDTTAGDFTVSASIGKSIMNGVALGTGLTVNDITTKTGFSLSQTFPSNFSSLAITAGGAVTAGTVSDKTGYALTQSFPTNFSSLAITALGKVTVGTNDDKTGYTASTVSDKTGYALISGYDPAKTAAQAGDAMTLTAAYDAAKTAATQTSVDDLPTNSELTAALAGSDDATLAAIAALNNLSAAQVNAEVDTALADYDGPTHAEMTAELASADDAVLTAIDALPTNAELATALAGADDATLAAISALNNLSAAEVRTELSTELGRIDAAVSSRLATGGYTAPPAASANASAVFSSVLAAGFTFEEIVRLVAAVNLGKTSGQQGVVRNLEDTADAVTVTYDGDDDRTAVTLNPA